MLIHGQHFQGERWHSISLQPIVPLLRLVAAAELGAVGSLEDESFPLAARERAERLRERGQAAGRQRQGWLREGAAGRSPPSIGLLVSGTRKPAPPMRVWAKGGQSFQARSPLEESVEKPLICGRRPETGEGAPILLGWLGGRATPKQAVSWRAALRLIRDSLACTL